MSDLAGGGNSARGQGYYVCPVCAGRFDVRQLVPELHPKNAPLRRFQRLALCCPHCKTVVRSRYEWRYAWPALFGLWFALIAVRMITRLPDPATKDQILLVLLGSAALYGLFAIVRRNNDPNAFVRDTRLDPPSTGAGKASDDGAA